MAICVFMQSLHEFAELQELYNNSNLTISRCTTKFNCLCQQQKQTVIIVFQLLFAMHGHMEIYNGQC